MTLPNDAFRNPELRQRTMCDAPCLFPLNQSILLAECLNSLLIQTALLLARA